MKELPKMYHNNIDKNINNNKKIFSTMYNSDIEVKSTNNFIKNKNNYTVEQKIYNISQLILLEIFILITNHYSKYIPMAYI